MLFVTCGQITDNLPCIAIIGTRFCQAQHPSGGNAFTIPFLAGSSFPYHFTPPDAFFNSSRMLSLSLLGFCHRLCFCHVAHRQKAGNGCFHLSCWRDCNAEQRCRVLPKMLLPFWSVAALLSTFTSSTPAPIRCEVELLLHLIAFMVKGGTPDSFGVILAAGRNQDIIRCIDCIGKQQAVTRRLCVN